ncbi:MAG: hypothetical protein COB13_004315 [OCS116 cluster bacterium]|nr:hypothetical protein [OCS116 cluster bacterium]
MTAIIMPVMLVMGGASIDLYRVYNLKANVQNISDSAVFAAMKDRATKNPTNSTENFMEKALHSLNYSGTETLSIVPSLEDNNTAIRLTTQLRIDNYILKLLNIPYFNISVVSKAKSFCAVQDASYIADAYLNAENEYVVTPNDYNQKGFIWMKNKYNLNLRQDISLRLYLGNVDAGGADGMTFTIHNDPSGLNAVGSIGEALGVAWHPSHSKNSNTIVAPAIVVEFDTWKNASDMTQDHTAIFTLGGTGVTLGTHTAYLDHRRSNELMEAVRLNNIENGEYHYARFIWDPNKNRIVYFFDGEKVGEKSINIRDFLNTDSAYFGFTGSTGGARNIHKACFQKVTLTH